VLAIVIAARAAARPLAIRATVARPLLVAPPIPVPARAAIATATDPDLETTATDRNLGETYWCIVVRRRSERGSLSLGGRLRPMGRVGAVGDDEREGSNQQNSEDV
jgi:hypothetical protein